jgi:hypothetical protein
MYNDTLRSLCEFPDQYDRMIALIIMHNPHCDGVDWASDAINQCILISLEDGDAATGMCSANLIKESGKVVLSLDPIGMRCTVMGEIIRQNYLNSQSKVV